MSQKPFPDLPKPADNPLQKPFWDAVAAGRLAFQRCDHCGHAFLPAREDCPHCLAPEPHWEAASGNATLISWVTYYRAFHPAFAERLPYVVAVVELAEGPRMITNITGAEDPEALRIEQPLVLQIEEDGGVKVPKFTPVL